MSETSQRYIVREIEGYRSGQRTATIDVMVLDRWDCYRVVAYFGIHGNSRGPHALPQRRLRAASVARKLEQDHRRWLAAV